MAKAHCRVCNVEFNRTGRQYTCTAHKGMINKSCKDCGGTFTSIEQHHVSYCEGCRSKPRLCLYCAEEFESQGTAKIAKFCSDSCSHKWRWHNKYYKKKGYNQAGENNNNWKGGIRWTYYRRLAFEEHGKLCQRCGAGGYLVHHKDRDRYNNDPNNLEVLCKRCHQIEHKCWLSFLGVTGIPR